MRWMTLAGLVCAFAMSVWAQGSRMEGCLAVQNGNYVLLQGKNMRYALRGDNNEFKRHLGETVRIEGQIGKGDLNVARITTLHADCTVTTAGSSASAAVGKTGNEGAAIPDTTTGTAGRTTPGYQTAGGVAQQPGKHTLPSGPSSKANSNTPAMPPNWEQAGQNPNSADVMAEAARRAEVDPGAPMGTNPAAPGSAGEEPQAKPPRTEAATQQERTVVIRDGACRPTEMRIRPGEAVQWVNYSDQRVHVASTRMHAATGVQGTSSFSGDVAPGKVFRQVFNAPGTYEYTCSSGKGQPAQARIEVRTE